MNDRRRIVVSLTPLPRHNIAAAVRDPQDRRCVIVEPIREGVAKRKPLFDGIDQAFAELMEE
jgi:DNA-binding MarR family transcriptional regulator